MDAGPSLRERQKSAAMRRIQETALDLFDAEGYENVSIERIAEVALVSPSSVYRWFGSKEQVVLYDDFDVDFAGAIEAELRDHPPVAAVRRAISRLLAHFYDRDEALGRRKIRYWLAEPALQRVQLEATEASVQQTAAALGRATNRPADDLEVQVTAAVLIWSMVVAVRHWHARGYETSLEAELEAALSVVERGLA